MKTKKEKEAQSNSNLLYNISDKPRTVKEWILYSLQMVLAVFVATVLIANICGTPVSACLIGACIGTLIYQLITRFKSPMFISSSGATVSAVIGALALSETVGHQNYLMVAIGGLVILVVYALFALLVRIRGINSINKIFPPTVVGPVTMVIGLNLATFLLGYTHNSATWEVIIAVLTMFVIAVSSHYFKGFLKTIPFLIGLAFGYILSLIVTWIGWADLVSFEPFHHLSWYPDLVFLKWTGADFSWSYVLQTVILFVPVAICALLEHYSDHKTLSNIIGTDLTVTPGLDKTLLGDGVASAVGTAVCGLPNTSYGEGIATVGFSRVASVWVVTAAAIFMGVLSFFAPVSAFIQTIPSCVFGGCAFILYGFIAASGLKTLMRSKPDLENTKNLIVVSVILTAGVSGIFLFSASFAGVSLAMVLGVILNLILRDKKEESGSGEKGKKDDKKKDGNKDNNKVGGSKRSRKIEEQFDAPTTTTTTTETIN